MKVKADEWHEVRFFLRSDEDIKVDGHFVNEHLHLLGYIVDVYRGSDGPPRTLFIDDFVVKVCDDGGGT